AELCALETSEAPAVEATVASPPASEVEAPVDVASAVEEAAVPLEAEPAAEAPKKKPRAKSKPKASVVKAPPAPIVPTVEEPAPVAANVSPSVGKPEGPARDDTHEATSAAADSSIRVNVNLLDKVMNLVGELVLVRNQILQFSLHQQESTFLGTSQR